MQPTKHGKAAGRGGQPDMHDSTSLPRSIMSAMAPAGRVNRKNGSAVNAEIMDMNRAE